MRNITAACILLGVICFVSGCKSPDIIVTDSAGTPIKGATITGTSLSIGGQTTKTNKKGFAKIPWAVQETKWITVSSPEHTTSSSIDVNQMKPIKVVLKKKIIGEPVK